MYTNLSKMTAKTESQCCSVVTGSKIFAVTNGIITGATWAAMSIWLLTLCGMLATSIKYEDNYRYYQRFMLIAIVLMFWTVSSIMFAFAVVLSLGVFKKKPGYVLAYFIFGIAKAMIVMAVSMALFLISEAQREFALITVGLSVLGGFLIYSACLAMVWFTYKKLKIESQFEHVILKLNDA